MPNKYPEEIKKQVVQFYKDGRPVSEISKELQIPFGTVYRWIDEYRSCISNDLDFTPAKFKALSRQLERANHLLRIIQLSTLIDEAPLRKRLEILAGIYENETYSVHELCDALNVARGTFYNHIFRRANRTEYLKKQTELMLLVQQIFDENDQRFGAEKIRIILAEHGFRVGTKNVSKSCRNSICTVFVRTQNVLISSDRKIDAGIWCNKILLRSGQTKFGSAILPISKSTITHCIFVSSSICFPEKS